MTSHIYHTSARGNPVRLTVEGQSGPVLLTLHGGGISNGSRRDEHFPSEIKQKWSGMVIGVDYRLLVPSSGHDINEDMIALFEFLLTLPIEHHQLFIAGFSGGGYPLRLAAIQGALESQRPKPRFTVRGWVSFFGMGGDLLLDHWLHPRKPHGDVLDSSNRDKEQETAKREIKAWLDPAAPESSDAPYTSSLDGHDPSRGQIWNYLHVFGKICDALAGESGLSAQLAQLPYDERASAVPVQHRAVFPQLYIEEQASLMPPCLLIHGDNDGAVPFEESLTTLKALKAGGGKVEMIVIQGADHDLKVGSEVSPDAHAAYDYIIEWMRKKLV